MELFLLHALNSLAPPVLPNHQRLPPFPGHSPADRSVTQLSPRLRYYSAVRLLAQHRLPLRSRL